MIAFRDIARPTDVRTIIAAAVPFAGFGNTLPLILPQDNVSAASYREQSPLLLANLNSFVLDFVARQKIQGTHLNWYIMEQLPALPASAYEMTIGATTVADLVRREVLKLSFTSHDMAPLARDMGHEGEPFIWDEEERRHSRARLDALYFLLYGLDREDAAYIMGTFPIVKKQDTEAFWCYLTRELVQAYVAAFEAGDTESRVVVEGL